MTAVSWRCLRGVNSAALRAARIQAHRATQWLARVARAYVPARPEDGHTNLGWDDALGGLVAHSLPDGARLGLCIAELKLVLLDSSGRKDSFALDGRRDADACDWLGRHPPARGIQAPGVRACPPYGVPPF